MKKIESRIADAKTLADTRKLFRLTDRLFYSKKISPAEMSRLDKMIEAKEACIYMGNLLKA